VSGGRHFGSRIAFDDEGYLFMTVGDRGERDRSQERSNAIGATLRLTDEGEIPPDNPFVGEDDAEPAIYSLGHRNVQAMAFHPDTGALWQIEHGPRGGDEINLPAKGQNFGWPLTSYGVEYGSRRAIGPDPHEHEGTVPPIHYWEDSFAPSGAAFYDGDAFPQWRGDLFVGSLAREHLARLSLDGDRIVAEEALLDDFSWRIRDVRTGPDDLLYVLIDAKDALLVRLVPADGT
jgi:aldose sugar dehydrogenase